MSEHEGGRPGLEEGMMECGEEAVVPEMVGELVSEVGGVTAPEREAVEQPEEERPRIDSIIESVLFAAGAPLPLRRLVDVLNGPSAKEVKQAIERLTEDYAGRERGVHLVAVASGFQFRTAPENAEWVRALVRERPMRLGRAALETLAIIAYKQPATRAEIEAIRGVDADSAISTLLSNGLVKIAGRKETVGRPLVYTTTPEFLEVFGLKTLNDLPALKEIGPAPETDDETALDDGDDWGTPAEDPERSRGQLSAGSGGDDPRRTGDAERPGGDDAGHEGEPEPGPDRG